MLLALLMGLLASFFSKNEFQAIQFIPLVILPQIFLSDIIWDIQTFPRAFQLLSYGLPLTHANIAVREMLVRGGDLTNVGQQLAVLGGFLVICMALIESVGRRQQAI
jgi:ABC-2 type transport system permease protein